MPVNLLCQVLCFIDTFRYIISELTTNGVTNILTAHIRVKFKNQRNFATKYFDGFKCKIKNGTKRSWYFSGLRYWQWDKSRTWNGRCSCKYVVATWWKDKHSLQNFTFFASFESKMLWNKILAFVRMSILDLTCSFLLTSNLTNSTIGFSSRILTDDF